MNGLKECPRCNTFHVNSAPIYLNPHNGQPFMGRSVYQFFELAFWLSLLFLMLISCFVIFEGFNGTELMFFLFVPPLGISLYVKRKVSRLPVRIENDCRLCGYHWNEASNPVGKKTRMPFRPSH